MIAKRGNEHPAAAYSALKAVQRIMEMSEDEAARCHYHCRTNALAYCRTNQRDTLSTL